MSGLLRPRYFAAGAGVGALLYMFPINVFETPAVKAIGDRHSAGGGSSTHTTGVATKLGDSSSTMNDQIKPKGIDSAHFRERQSEQKIGDGNTSSAMMDGANLHKAVYGEANAKVTQAGQPRDRYERLTTLTLVGQMSGTRKAGTHT
ncbi:hypothetical protein LTR53_006403 [Teratosphaeriaceae sp. CCFEE 6253]|nr:hypothetical protein LTR53_006403 [Teratosphaeriaceae sp. CCFEE 6253]